MSVLPQLLWPVAFVLVGQPSSVRADVVNPAYGVPDADSVSARDWLAVEVLKAVDVALRQRRQTQHLKQAWMLQALQKKVNVADKDQVVAPKEEVQAKPESRKKQKMRLSLRLQFL